jgi:hypothetical protein
MEMEIDWLLVTQCVFALWYVATTVAIWRFCDAMDGDYFWLRVGVALFWPIVLPVCGVIFFLGYLEGKGRFDRKRR